MVEQEAACRGWRACVALHRMSSAQRSCSCGSFSTFDDQPDLSNVILALESSDMVQNIEALHHLSVFLLYVAPTLEATFDCPDADTVSLRFRNKDILLNFQDIQMVYKAIFCELSICKSWLFCKEHFLYKSGQMASYNKYSNKEFVVKLLQCCIYILPLLEFNTCLSLIAAETINSFFKQLVHPANLFQLHLKEFDEMIGNDRRLPLKCPHNVGRLQSSCCTHYTEATISAPVSLITSVELSIKAMLESSTSHNYAHVPSFDMYVETEGPLHDESWLRDRSQIALALLEVFLEEMLLQPGLANNLMASEDPFLSQSQLVPAERFTWFPVEAAVMHFIFWFLGVARTKLLQQGNEHNYFPLHHSRLSLPAAVVLLDLCMVDDVQTPEVFSIHVINILKCSVQSSSSKEMPEDMLLGFVASALESAVSIYLKCQNVSPGTPHEHSWQTGKLINCLSSKLQNVPDGDAGKTASLLSTIFDQDNNWRAFHQGHESAHCGCFCASGSDLMSAELEMLPVHFYNSVFIRQSQEHSQPISNSRFFSVETTFLGVRTILLISVLQLISAAVFSLVAEASKGFKFSRVMNGTDQNSRNAEVYIRQIRQVFRFCATVDKNKVLETLSLDKGLLDVILEVDKLTGNAFTFFAEKLLQCSKDGTQVALQHAYLDVLRSLSALHFTLQRSFSSSATANELSCKVPENPSDIITVSKLEGKNNIQGSADFAASALFIAKIYQHKRESLISNCSKIQTRSSSCGNKQLDVHQHVPKKGGIINKHEMITTNYISAGNGDAYIKELLALQGSTDGQAFDDLSDFVVCKTGRDYSRWMKLRLKKRKKKMRRMLLSRVKEKKALISLLRSRSRDYL